MLQVFTTMYLIKNNNFNRKLRCKWPRVRSDKFNRQIKRLMLKYRLPLSQIKNNNNVGVYVSKDTTYRRIKNVVLKKMCCKTHLKLNHKQVKMD